MGESNLCVIRDTILFILCMLFAIGTQIFGLMEMLPFFVVLMLLGFCAVFVVAMKGAVMLLLGLCFGQKSWTITLHGECDVRPCYACKQRKFLSNSHRTHHALK